MVGCERTTPTEAAAIAAAKQDHTAYMLPAEKLVKARALYREDVVMELGDALWGVVVLVGLLELGVAARLERFVAGVTANRWGQGFGFLFGFLLLTTALSLPIGVYAHHESLRYGLSVEGWGAWLGDRGKGFLLSWVVGGFGVMLVFVLIRRFPRRWWLALWFPTMLFVVLGVFLTPYVIDPLFNHFEPLAKTNPELVKKLELVASKGKGIAIPPERMFLMRASEKSTTMNAYVTGFGASKRVVVWDTSIAKGTTDEILLIFGHEMGHYVLGHIVRGILLSFVFILVGFRVGFHLAQWLLRRYGGRWGIRSQGDWSALVVYVLVLSVLSFVCEPLENAISRADEHAADVYGQEVVHGIVGDPQRVGVSSFQLLGETSLDYPYPSEVVEWWTGSHPPVWFRAAFARAYDPWASGAEPKYFSK